MTQLEEILEVVPASAILRELSRARTLSAAAERLGVTRPWLDRFVRESTDEAIRGAYRACVARGKHHGVKELDQ